MPRPAGMPPELYIRILESSMPEHWLYVWPTFVRRNGVWAAPRMHEVIADTERVTQAKYEQKIEAEMRKPDINDSSAQFYEDQFRRAISGAREFKLKLEDRWK